VSVEAGWGHQYLADVRPGQVLLDPGEQLAVQQALVRYAFALDQHDVAALSSVLTDDATWRFRIAGDRGSEPVVGRAAILDLVRASIADETVQRRHNLANVVPQR
jgi:hypothetical protein